MSPTNYVRHVGIKNRKVLKLMEYIDQLENGEKAILLSPEQVKNGFKIDEDEDKIHLEDAEVLSPFMEKMR